jgi:hypothetical protein
MPEKNSNVRIIQTNEKATIKASFYFPQKDAPYITANFKDINKELLTYLTKQGFSYFEDALRKYGWKLEDLDIFHVDYYAYPQDYQGNYKVFLYSFHAEFVIVPEENAKKLKVVLNEEVTIRPEDLETGGTEAIILLALAFGTALFIWLTAREVRMTAYYLSTSPYAKTIVQGLTISTVAIVGAVALVGFFIWDILKHGKGGGSSG